MAERMTETSQQNKSEPVSVRISEDFMTAYVRLEPPPYGEVIKEVDVRRALSAAGVKQGILQEAIDKMLSGKRYYQETEVALGKAAVDGADGEYILMVPTEPPQKPMELPDGTVDYTNMELFIPVDKGQLLARYEPATTGMFGFSVTGQLIVPKKGKDLPKLKGKGFDYQDEKREYYASFDGRVEYRYGEMEVSRVFTVNSNLDMTVGNIHFSGDVEVNGDVAQGMKIEAGGTVVISGHVSSAYILAGQDIVLKGGMQGDNIGKISAAGNITGKFVEAVTVECGGNFTANYILNCKLSVKGSVEISGKKGVIIGGTTSAVYGIKAAEIGNQAFLPTVLIAGVGEEFNLNLLNLKKKLKKTDDELSLLTKGKLQIEEAAPAVQQKNKEMYEKVLQAISLKQAEREELLEKDRALSQLIAETQKVKIISSGSVYPGVRVNISAQTYLVKETFRNVSFKIVDNVLTVVQNV